MQFDRSPAVSRRVSYGLLPLLVLLLFGLSSAVSEPAFGWGSQGHSHMTGGSIGHLPEPLKSFFQANVSTIRSIASQEPPGKHYIDIDYYSEFFAGTFPRDVDDLIATYGYSYVEENGMGPWTYENYVQQLTGLMQSAVTKQDWVNLLPVAGAGAHYIEDLHNPLHVTKNHNGQDTGNDGIHSRYETQMVNRNLASLTFTTTPAVYLSSVIDDTLDGIEVHYYFGDDIMDADDAALAVAGSYNTTYYNEMWDIMGDDTKVFFERGAQAVANGWYTAWVNAGSPTPNLGVLGDYNGNNRVDAADYSVWRDAVTAGTTSLLNDSTPGTVNDADFTYWRAHFGESLGGGAGAGSASAVPEPATMTLLALAALGGFAARRKRIAAVN